MADAIRAARAIDVHVYPVASSGVDDLTELWLARERWLADQDPGRDVAGLMHDLERRAAG